VLLLESRLIGTFAGCNVCKASEGWLERFSPIEDKNQLEEELKTTRNAVF